MKNPFRPGLCKRMLIDFLVSLSIGFAFLFLKKSDKKIAARTGLLSRLVRKFDPDSDLADNLQDISNIFRAGPPGSDIARQMMFGSRPERVRMIVRGNFLYK